MLKLDAIGLRREVVGLMLVARVLRLVGIRGYGDGGAGEGGRGEDGLAIWMGVMGMGE